MRTVFLVITFCLWAVSLMAGQWALTANTSNSSITTTYFPDKGEPEVYGPFLSESFNNGADYLIDAAASSDCQTAIVTSMSGAHFINISKPYMPEYLKKINLSFPTFDVAISSDSRYAALTGGVFEQKVALLDMSSKSLIAEYTLKSSNGTACAWAVAIAPDNQTVILCSDDQLVYGILDASAGINSETALACPYFPINAAISPDGKTLIVGHFSDTISVYRIVSPGVLVPGNPATVSGLPGKSQQSIAFSVNGTNAYVLSTGPMPNVISSLKITAPGEVSLDRNATAFTLSTGSAALMGSETITVLADGKIVATNPSGGSTTSLSLIDPADWSVAGVQTSVEYPLGISTLCSSGFGYVVPFLSNNYTDAWNGCGVSNIMNNSSNTVNFDFHYPDGSSAGSDTMTIPANGHAAKVLSIPSVKGVFWAEVSSQNPVSGVVLIGNSATSGSVLFDGDFLPIASASKTLVAPHIDGSADWESYVCLVNPNNYIVNATLTTSGTHGILAGDGTVAIAPMGMVTVTASKLSNPVGTLKVNSTMPVLGQIIYLSKNGVEKIAGLKMSNY